MNQAQAITAVVMACCLQLEVAGQTTFNRRYDPTSPGQGQVAWTIEQDSDDGFVVIANCAYSDPDLGWFYSSVTTALRINGQGEAIGSAFFTTPYKANYPGWANSSAVCADGTIVFGGNTFDSSQVSRVALFTIDIDGAPDAVFELDMPAGDWVGRQAKQALDGGFVICGETSAVGSGLQSFLLKTDAQGDQQWVQTYGGPFNDYFNAVDMRPGNGYYLGGQYTTSFENPDLWVRAVNATGGLIWNKVWGGAYREPNAHLTTAADGHALIASAWGYPSSTTRLYMAKLHQADGSIIWDRMYGSIMVNTTFFVVQEIAPGGDLIATGQVTDGFTPKGVLLRTTSAGDSLWMRYYTYYDQLVTNGRGQFRDVQPTPDGGFIAVGTALGVSGVYNQDVWVVKTDQHGCIEPGCHLITGIETQITNLRGALTVAPNPVASGSSVQVSIALPEGFAVQGALRVTVTDAAGRVVQEQLIGEAGHRELRGTKQEAIPASLTTTQLPSGLYHIHLSDATHWIAGAKLIVE